MDGNAAYQIDKDLPIKDETEDSLGRGDFAQALANMIEEYTYVNGNNDGLVVGVEGEWGSGKTSFLKMLECFLENSHLQDQAAMKSKLHIKWLNAWLCNDRLGMLNQFFNTLLTAAEEGSVFGKEDMKKYGKKILKGLAHSTTISIIPNTVSFSIANFYDEISGKETLLDIKESVRKTILEQAKNKNEWIIIFIDDIDRLSYEQIAILFQLVKNIADFPHVIYVLAYDREVVAKALEKVQQGRGNDYIEKVVQLTFPLPKPDTEYLFDYMENSLDEFKRIYAGGKGKFEKEHFKQLWSEGIKNYLRTLRSCHQVLNAFRARYIFIKDEVEISDLVALIVLEIFESGVTDKLFRNKEGLLQGSADSYFRVHKLEVIKSIEDNLSVGQHESGMNIIRKIFPVFDNEMKNNPPLVNSGKGTKYIYDPDSFDSYFSLKSKF